MMSRCLPLILVCVPLGVAAAPPAPDLPSPEDGDAESSEHDGEPDVDDAGEPPDLEPLDTAEAAAVDLEPLDTAEPTAGDVAGAPPPGQESGRIDPQPRSDGPVRSLGRALLFVPYALVHIVFTPVRLGLWAYDRYHLSAVAQKVFFDDTLTYGVYPIASLDLLYGLNVGARFVHRDVFGEREHLSVEAAMGGPSHLVSARLRSGARFGERVNFELAGRYENRPKDFFYGVGDDDGIPQGEFARTVNYDLIETRFQQRIAQAAVIGNVRVAEALHLRGTGVLADYEFDNSDVGVPIDEVYPPETLVGFEGYSQAYAELELQWDTRRAADEWEVPTLRTEGSLLSGFAGRVIGLDNSDSYWRVGTDLQHLVRVGRGPRVLIGRLYAEAVSGSLDEVPFNQLPQLGGKTLLRGYPINRFRDRVAAVGSLEYVWDLSRRLSASTFIDAGSVFPALDELDEGNLRVGYGVSFGVYTERSFLLRASIASSFDDGGVFVHVSFDHVLDLSPREERR